jgi:molybdopterin-guanine dinucleotide biosynthesis protein A
LFVVACDTPFVTKELVEYITQAHTGSDVAVASLNGKVNPLCGVYYRSSFPIIEQSLNDHSLRIQEMFKRLDTRIVPISSTLPFYDENLLANFNEPKEFKKFLERHRKK